MTLWFQHTAARRRLGIGIPKSLFRESEFQHTAARRRLEPKQNGTTSQKWQVSTHSRPKAAGFSCIICVWRPSCFNTQPPEGGWLQTCSQTFLLLSGFNTQPPEGGWLPCHLLQERFLNVSTHSRPKAAGPA